MVEKRYFEKWWEDEYYLFDSETITEKEFDEKLEYEDYRAFEDSMMGKEVVDTMNMLYEENQKNKIIFDKIKNRINQLETELNDTSDYFLPRDGVFNNLMRDTYRKEMREELSALKWVSRLKERYYDNAK